MTQELILLEAILKLLAPHRGTEVPDRVLRYAHDWAHTDVPSTPITVPERASPTHPEAQSSPPASGGSTTPSTPAAAGTEEAFLDAALKLKPDAAFTALVNHTCTPSASQLGDARLEHAEEFTLRGAPPLTMSMAQGVADRAELALRGLRDTRKDSRGTSDTSVRPPSVEDVKSQALTRMAAAVNVAPPRVKGTPDAAIERMVSHDQKRAGFSAYGKRLGRPPKAAPPPPPAKRVVVNPNDPDWMRDKVFPLLRDLITAEEAPVLASELVERLKDEHGVLVLGDNPAAAVAGTLFRSGEFVHGIGGWWFVNQERPNGA